MQLWRRPAEAAARPDDHPDEVAPMQNPEDFLKTFDSSMRYLKLDHVDLLSLHGVNNASFFDFATPEEWLRGSRAEAAARGRVRFLGFPPSHHRHHPGIRSPRMNSITSISIGIRQPSQLAGPSRPPGT